jgi:hypothetical protein
MYTDSGPRLQPETKRKECALHRIVATLIVIGCCLAGIQAGRGAIAQTLDARQLAPVALSAADVPGFHVLSEQDVPVKANDAIASAWQRVLGADDAAASGGAALSVLLMVPNASVGTDTLKAVVNAAGAFSSVTGATNLQPTGSLGVGDVDQSATWQEWDTADNTWDAFYADEFLAGKTIAAIIYGSHNDAADPTRIVILARREAQLLSTMTQPASPANATPTPAR